MTTNRSGGKSRKRNYKKEVRQQGNATPGGKKAKTKQRAKTNKARRDLGLKKGDPREASHKRKHGKGAVRKEDGNKNARRQPKRKKNRK